MPKKLWKIVEEWREKGVNLSDDEAVIIYRYCIRKMEVAKVKNPVEYVNLLYPDEIRNYLFKISVNATTMLKQIKKEVEGNVFDLFTDSLPSPMS